MIVEELYAQAISAWTAGDADKLAELFILDGELIEADGTELTGRGQIHEQLLAQFRARKNPAYQTELLGVTTVTTDVAIVRARVSAPERLVQRMTAVLRGGDWRIALLQITKAK